MYIFKKLFTISLIIGLIISVGAPNVLAGFSYPSPSSAMSQILGSLGVNTTELKNNIQIMNVSRQKKTPPQVSLNFTPASPVAGTKITANASPTYFMNDSSKLYFTWYLQHNTGAAAGTDTEGRKTKDGNTDWNGDGRIDIEDYKITAMRIIASGNFEWENESYFSNSDSDSYRAVFGGDDQKNKATHCFAHNFTTGNEYELPTCEHLFPNAPGEVTGDNSFGRNEEKFWHTNPNSDDTANSGTLDEAAVAGLGKESFSWIYLSGDKVGVVVEGISIESTSYADSSYKTMWAMPKNNCETDIESGIPADDSTQTQTTTIDGTDQIITTTTVSNHYSTGDYVIKTGNAPGIAILAVKTVTIRTQKYHAKVFPQTGYEEVAYSDVTETPAWVTANNTAFSGDEINLFYSSNTRYPNPSEATPTGQVLEVDPAFNLNDCLVSNLVEPTEGTSDKNLDILLSYSPEAPMNDSTGENADELIIQSSVLNAENNNFINYDWTVSKPEASMSGDFVAMNSAEKTAAGLVRTSGIGLQNLKIKLGFNQTATFYIKITLRAKESTSKEGQKEGVGSVIIPIYNIKNKIQVFSTTVSEETSEIHINPNAERCVNINTNTSTLCSVVKNEIIGLKTNINDPANYNLAWVVNGEPLKITNENGTAYFPVLEDKGAKYTVNLNASSKSSSDKIILTKTFVVTDPKISIISTDPNTCAPLLLGHYVDPINKNPNPDTADNSLWPDYSEDLFEALQGSVIKLGLNQNTSSLDKLAWIFNGMIVTPDNASSLGLTLGNDNTLSFIANKLFDESYTVGVTALYTQPNSVKKALFSNWNIPLTAFYEKPIGDSITIKVTDYISSGATLQAKNNNVKVLASLFSAVPGYVNFLFRILLTIALILFSTGLLFSFFPKQS